MQLERIVRKKRFCNIYKLENLSPPTFLLNLSDTMDIDEAMEKIGEFGPSQKKIFCLLNIAHVFCAFHILAFSFIGDGPDWSCVQPGNDGMTTPAIENTDLNVCKMFKEGTCTPQFSSEYTSIETEVQRV